MLVLYETLYAILCHLYICNVKNIHWGMLHFAKNVSKNSNLDDSRISFPSRTNLKLYTVTPRMVKKVITDLDSWKVSGPELFILFI